MREHAAAEMGKSGQIRDTKPKKGQVGVRENCDFFPGHVIKNRDCAGKSWMNGHLSRAGFLVIAESPVMCPEFDAN